MGMWADIRFTLFLMAGGQHLLSRQVVKGRALRERAFVLHVAAELMGASLLSPADGLRLLPYMVPVVMAWRRSASATYEAWEQGTGGLRC